MTKNEIRRKIAKITEKTIEGALIAEACIDPSCDTVVRYGEGYHDFMILSGICRPKDVQNGDKGKLVYSTSGSYGLWFFVKEEK